MPGEAMPPEGGQQGTPQDAFEMISNMLEGLKGAIAQAGAPPKAIEIVDQMLALKDQLASVIGGGGGAPGERPAVGGAPEAAGNPRAVPVR